LSALFSIPVFSRNNQHITDQTEAFITHALAILDNGEYESARELFHNAVFYGMTIDSLNYFLAKTYMYEGFIEDALKFNGAIDAPPGSLIRRMQLEQRYAIYLVAQDSAAAQEVYDSLVFSYSTVHKQGLSFGLSVATNAGFDFSKERQEHDFLFENTPSYTIRNIGPYAFGNLSLKLRWETESVSGSRILFGLQGKTGKSSSRNPSLTAGHLLDTILHNINMSIQPFAQWNDIAGIWSVNGNYSLFFPGTGTPLQSLQINNGIHVMAGSWFFLAELGIYTSIKPLLHGSVDLYLSFDQTYQNEHGFTFSLSGAYINEATLRGAFTQPQSILYNDGWPDDYIILIKSETDTCTLLSEDDYCQNITTALFFNEHPQQLLSIAPEITYRFSPRPWFAVESTIGYKYDFYLQLSRWQYLNLPSSEVSSAVYLDEFDQPFVDVTYDEQSGHYYITNAATGNVTSILNEMQKRRIDNIVSAELLFLFAPKNSRKIALTFGVEKTFSNFQQLLPVEINDYTAYAYASWYFTYNR
jgi:hypothetical protein